MGIPHISFFEALAVLPDESCPEWRTISSGLLTLRFVDSWVREGESLVQSDSWTLRMLRKRIAEVDEPGSTRALLTSILDAMVATRQPGMAVVAPRLMAYARSLQFEAKWEMAADVYRSVLRHVGTFEDVDISIMAHMQLGACLRVLARWGEALTEYGMAGQIAGAVGDLMGALRARVAEANVALARGNLPQAEIILDETIEHATNAGLLDIRAIALQDRGIVARQRGDFDLSISCTYEALNSFHDQVAKDRALADLAVTFYDLGLLSAAREANLMLAATAQEQYTRWVALINLLEIAAMDHREPIFEQYRRELGEANLPAWLAAHYHLYAGQGYRLFGNYDRARAELEHAIEIATRNQVNEVLIRAEESLNQLHAGSALAMKESVEPSPAVAKVAGAIREMRALAGVSE